jgi:hypothetical protein
VQYHIRQCRAVFSKPPRTKLTGNQSNGDTSVMIVERNRINGREFTVLATMFKLNGDEVKKSPDFCYLGSVVAGDGEAKSDVNVRIQKARGLFSKLRKVWLSTSIRKETKIKIFNACVKSVFLYGCETCFVTSEIRHKIQTSVNRCLRYILSMVAENYLP